MRHLTGLGIRILANAHTVLRRDGGALVLAGVTERFARATGHPGPHLDAALAGEPAGVPVVLLDHQPANAARAAARGVALQLSERTHGGMIRGLDRLVARSNAGFVSDAYQIVGGALRRTARASACLARRAAAAEVAVRCSRPALWSLTGPTEVGHVRGSIGSNMEASDLKRRPPYRVLTFGDGQKIIAEDVETSVAAHTRFASAVDLCRTGDGTHSHRVELHAGADVVDVWSSTTSASQSTGTCPSG